VLKRPNLLCKNFSCFTIIRCSYENPDFYGVTRIIYDIILFKLFVFSGIVTYGLSFFARVRGSNMYNLLASTNHIILL